MRGRIVLVAVAVAVLAAVGCDPKQADKKADAEKKARSATVVVVGNKGVTKTHLVFDAKQVAALEAFFPDYQKRPASNIAGGWKAGYYVYLDFPGGESVKLVVSPTTHEKVVWSAGQGDHAVNGDFAKFLAGLDE